MIEFNEIKEQLINPQFYPHSISLEIKQLQTHISWIFLTGDYAYKLKKSVNFGFLDFSTLAKRKYFLEEELRLNQLIASDLYLAVVPISLVADQLILGDESNPVEYVLKMRQFPQENLLSEMFDQGKLTGEHIEKLAKTIADFHTQTSTNDYILSFGTVAKIREAIEGNYQATTKYIGIAQTQQHYEETHQFTEDYLTQKADLFQQRQAQHKIRECHGDLHLKNICYWQDKIYLFDRIEFNEPFRFVDVMYDLAFAVMDLEAKGRKDWGNLLLNSYSEQTGDWEGLQVLPLYLSRQAYVRAKVTSFLLDDENVSVKEKEEAKKTASHYYHLAWQYSQPQPQKLILMSGLSGSGKSTVARQLCQEINAIHLRSDAVRKHLAGLSLEEKGTDALYTSSMTEKTYQRLLELAEKLLKQGFCVILDAKFDRQSWREKGIKLAQSLSIPIEILYCTAPMNILRDRLSHRTGDISDATPQLLQHQIAHFDPFNEQEHLYLTTIDTRESAICRDYS